MEKIIKYRSILGSDFDTPAEAMKDEDRLIGLIKIYQNDLDRIESGKLFEGEKEYSQQAIENIKNALKRFKEKWKIVQEQRKGNHD